MKTPARVSSTAGAGWVAEKETPQRTDCTAVVHGLSTFPLPSLAPRRKGAMAKKKRKSIISIEGPKLKGPSLRLQGPRIEPPKLKVRLAKEEVIVKAEAMPRPLCRGPSDGARAFSFAFCPNVPPMPLQLPRTGGWRSQQV